MNQEDINNRTIALAVKTSKLTTKELAKALTAFLRYIRKRHREGLTPQGRQSVKKLMNHRVATDAIPLDGETRLFDAVARKYNVDYAFHKVGPKKHLLFFKAGQADAITAAFSDYTKRVVVRAKDRYPPIREQLQREAGRAQPKSREHSRDKEVSRDER